MILNYLIKLLIKQLILFWFLKCINLLKSSKIYIEPKLLRFMKYKQKPKNNNDDKNVLNSITDYINLIKKKKIKKINYIHEINEPKISFIIPIFNKEKYLETLILSIQHQLVEEFEIIFIDDFSNDNSVKIINKFLKIDRRIKLIKNKLNKGTLYSRCYGVLHSNGEYINFVDPDDFVLKNGLYNSYNYIKKNRLSIVQFNTIFQRLKHVRLNTRYYKYDTIIRQPILSHIFFYNAISKNGVEMNSALWDKLIQRDTVIKAVNFIGEDYYNEKIKIENDVILLFSLFQIADSYQYINEIGYYYIKNNSDSITNSWLNPNIASSVIHGVFVNIKFLYEKTGNSRLEKSFCLFKLQQSFKRYYFCFKKAKKEYNFIKDILKLLLKFPYFLENDKLIISIIYSSITLFCKKKYIKIK